MTCPPDLMATLPDVICDHLRVGLPDLKTCKRIAGKFNLDELKKSVVPAPAVLVSVLGAKQGQYLADTTPVFNFAHSRLKCPTLGVTGQRRKDYLIGAN